MAITEKQREARKHYIGASDVSAIMGTNPYQNAHDLYLVKRGLVPDFQGNDATRWGERLEPIILAAAKEEGLIDPDTITEGDTLEYVSDECRLMVHPDGLQPDQSVVEAKTTGVVSPINYEEWADGGFPARHQTQIEAQMLATGADYGVLIVLLPGRGLQKWVIERDANAMDFMIDKIADFWQMVENGTPPPDVSPSIQSLRQVHREPGREVEIEQRIVDRFNDAKLAAKLANDAFSEWKNIVIAQLGNEHDGFAEIGNTDSHIVSYKANKAGTRYLSVVQRKEPRHA